MNVLAKIRKKTSKIYAILALIIIIGAFFNFYHINFGLPHSWYADEPEIGEFAIKYTYTIKDIIKNNDWYKLIPVSFVYGTVPTYLYTLATMIFSKFSGLMGFNFDKADIYIFLRSINALISLVLIPVVYGLYKHLYNNKNWALVGALLTALNWKFIVHAHYLNADILITVFLTLAAYFALLYYEKTTDSKYTWLVGICLGLAVGTKITAALTFPLFFYLFISKKDYRGLEAIILLIIATFFATNPFSIIFPDKFAFRVFEMLTKENGIVFDSVDFTFYKYFLALAWICTPLFFMFSLYGNSEQIKEFKPARFKKGHVLLIGSIIFYIVFYSIGTRRVDRWMLPILPFLIVYGVRGIQTTFKKPIGKFLGILAIIIYFMFPVMLLFQFQRNTPRTSAYIWAKENLDPALNKYVITEEGLDPLNKLPGTTVKQFNVYSSEGAQLEFPPDPKGYDYIFVSSRPMENFKRKVVIENFPTYATAWQDFENTLLDNSKFELIKVFELPKPNLIPLSDMFVFRNGFPIR